MLDRPQLPPSPPEREPAINAPTVILVVLGLLILIHVLREFVSRPTDFRILMTFAFLPIRYDPKFLQGAVMPGGAWADVWTFGTYMFLHADWMHLIVNSIWMLAFGTAVAWRFGTVRFLLFSLICGVAGALLHLALHFGQPVPVIGASAAISGQMAAAIRFVFQPGAPLGLFRMGGPMAFRVPALPLSLALRDSRVVGFLVTWLIVNFVFGLGVVGFAGAHQTVAWEAHAGGFFAGLLLFRLFDPIPVARLA